MYILCTEEFFLIKITKPSDSNPELLSQKKPKNLAWSTLYDILYVLNVKYNKCRIYEYRYNSWKIWKIVQSLQMFLLKMLQTFSLQPFSDSAM